MTKTPAPNPFFAINATPAAADFLAGAASKRQAPAAAPMAPTVTELAQAAAGGKGTGPRAALDPDGDRRCSVALTAEEFARLNALSAKMRLTKQQIFMAGLMHFLGEQGL